jgi:hypothetical protein
VALDMQDYAKSISLLARGFPGFWKGRKLQQYAQSEPKVYLPLGLRRGEGVRHLPQVFVGCASGTFI